MRKLSVFQLFGTMLFAAAGAQASTQETIRYIHTDALGSIVAVTDTNGRVIERREYEPYGAQLVPEVQDGPGYTGHVQDAQTGLVYMQQRYYDASIGHFLSVDPIAAYGSPATQFNRYRYADDNPYRFTDPDGRRPKPDSPLVKYQHVTRTPTEGGAVRVERQTVSDYGIANGKKVESRGEVSLLPQASAGGDPVTTGDAILTKLLNFSDKEGKVVEVTSGQRTVDQNRAVGGASRSQHLLDNAADIRINGNTPGQTADAAHASGEFNRVNEYSNNRGVHVDSSANGTQGRLYDWSPRR